jgi:hypothetical protein
MRRLQRRERALARKSAVADSGGRFIELESHDGTRIDSGTENKLEERNVTRRITPARS